MNYHEKCTYHVSYYTNDDDGYTIGECSISLIGYRLTQKTVEEMRNEVKRMNEWDDDKVVVILNVFKLEEY